MRLVSLAATLAVLALPAGAARSDDNPVLDAIVGTNDSFDITLNDASGRKVLDLAPGTYTIVVHDRSAIHNFHLASNDDPTVDFRTDVPFVGDMTFTATFKPGLRYAYACEPHWQVLLRRAVRRFAAALRITVTDHSGRHEFRPAGRGVNRRTGRTFTGVATWTVTLARGSYTYRSDVARSKHRLRVG
jgi:hypothetical protein